LKARESFTTRRLRADRVAPSDRAFYAAMFSDPRVFAGLGGPRDAQQVDDLVETKVRGWADDGFGTYVMRTLAGSETVGWVGLKATDVGGPNNVELLYSVAADHWRRGYASEAGAAALAVARDDLGLDEVIAFALIDNVGSRAVMEKLGFAFDCEFVHHGLLHVLYRRRCTDG
jgi:RimJ/RimL family protein N-acetyltransferase